MTFPLQEITKKTYESNDATTDNTMKNTQLLVVQENHQGMLKLLSLLHSTLKTRASPYSSLKDAVKVSVEVLDCKPLQQVLTSRGISH